MTTKTRIRSQRRAITNQIERLEERTLLSMMVTNVNDSGPGSLRQAILDVNADTANPGADTILFAVPGAGVQTIRPVTDLPPVTHPVFIDGYSQPGASPNARAVGDDAVMKIEIDGSLNTATYGLRVDADGSTVRGLVVNRFAGQNFVGIVVSGAHDVVEGCFIGTDASGELPLGNYYGVNVTGVGSRLGTDGDGVDDFAERNVISASLLRGASVGGVDEVAAGNYIGTDASGTVALGNWRGIEVGGPTRLGVDGGTADPVAERNIISGNHEFGLFVGGPVWVSGNYVGLDATGDRALGNGSPSLGVGGGGISLVGTGTLVGSNTDGVGDDLERNVVSGNRYFGIELEPGVYGNHIAGNYIGTNAAGTAAVGNYVGVQSYGHDNLVGVNSRVAHPEAERNIISGNEIGVGNMEAGDVIAGNYIGTGPSGESALPNTYGIQMNSSTRARIGTDSDGVGDNLERNVISGNGVGVQLSGSSQRVVVAGNFIGVDASGAHALGNSYGVSLSAGDGQTYIVQDNLIGVDGHAPVPSHGRNVISGNVFGVFLSQTFGSNTIAGNFIGTDATGRIAVPNGWGIQVQADSPSTRIGTDGDGFGDAAEGNVISGNTRNGIELASTGTVVTGNSIGVNIDGNALGNAGLGIWNYSGTSTQIGGPGVLANTIADNGGAGVNVLSGQGNSIRGNSIFANGGLGIDLGYYTGDGVTLNGSHATGESGPNNWQTFPVLSKVYGGPTALITGTLASTPLTAFTVDFYANPAADPTGYGEGQRYLGSAVVTTDALGNAVINPSTYVAPLASLSPGEWVSVTATGPSGTSEFGLDVVAVPLPPSSVSVLAFSDFNDDGQVDFGESGIGGVSITLAGTDVFGQVVNISQTTDADGTSIFHNLRPGHYTITEVQPAGYTQGTNTVGTGGGTVNGDVFDLYLAAGLDAMNYNYGERPAATGPIQKGQTAGIGFWNNKNGQALIKALNGGVGTELGDWMAATFPHMFGAYAGGNNLSGASNASVASFFQTRFVLKDQKLDAQVLATALAVYVTDGTLDGTGAGTKYGFTVGGNGVGTSTFNVGTNGSAFGVADGTVMTVMDILLAADAQSVNGVLYGGNATKRNKANTVFSAINQAGGI